AGLLPHLPQRRGGQRLALGHAAARQRPRPPAAPVAHQSDRVAAGEDDPHANLRWPEHLAHRAPRNQDGIVDDGEGALAEPQESVLHITKTAHVPEGRGLKPRGATFVRPPLARGASVGADAPGAVTGAPDRTYCGAPAAHTALAPVRAITREGMRSREPTASQRPAALWKAARGARSVIVSGREYSTPPAAVQPSLRRRRCKRFAPLRSALLCAESGSDRTSEAA